MNDPRQPRSDDVVLGGQFQAPMNGLVLGGLEGVKQRFESGDIEAQKAALEQALQYWDKGVDFLSFIASQDPPDEMNRWARRCLILGSIQKKITIDLRCFDVDGADLSKADLRGADLAGVKLCEADFSRADLREVKIDALTQIDEKWRLVGEIVNHGAVNRNLSGVDLSEADLSGADLSGADLRQVDLSDANLSEANLSGADLRQANLYDAWLSDANLSGANLSNAKLRQADLRKANLSGANLRGVILSRADLTGAIVNGQTFIAQKWKKEPWWNSLNNDA